jgi:hypothetical protein
VEITSGSMTEMCAREREGRVLCWQEDAWVRPIQGLPPAVRFVDGASCAVVARDGAESVACWSGDPATVTAVKGLGKVRGFVAGPGGETAGEYGSACALDERGTVRCWGNVGMERYRDDTPPEPGTIHMIWQIRPMVSRAPRPVAGGTGIKELSTDGCALRADGTVGLLNFRCGLGLRCPATVASPVTPLRAARLIPGTGCFAEDALGNVAGLSPTNWDRPSPPPVLTRTSLHAVRAIATDHVTCALLRDGTARCDPTEDGSFAALLSDEPSTEVGVYQGDRACVLLEAGGVRCRKVEQRALGPLEDPLSRGTAVPVAVFPDRSPGM